MSTGSARSLLVGLGLGLALGLGSSAAGSASSPYGTLGELVHPQWYAALAFVSLLIGAGWAWAALSVLVGWRASTLPAAGLGGAAALVAATVSYYLLDAVLRDEPFMASDVWHWSLASLVLGPPLGVVGGLVRRGGVLGVLAALVVPVGAALQMAVLAPGIDPLEPRPVAEVARATVGSASVVAIALVLVRSSAGRRT